MKLKMISLTEKTLKCLKLFLTKLFDKIIFAKNFVILLFASFTNSFEKTEKFFRFNTKKFKTGFEYSKKLNNDLCLVYRNEKICSFKRLYAKYKSTGSITEK